MRAAVYYQICDVRVASENARVNRVNIAALNRKRNMVRYSSVAVAAVDLVAILMIMAGWQLPGCVIGLAALIGGAVFKRREKKAYQEACCRLQTLGALGVADAEYIGEKKESADWLLKTRLTPTSASLTQPLLLHAVKGQLRGMPVMVCEATLGCQEPGKRQATYSSGVLVRAELKKEISAPALLLGRYAFKHAALRAEYEKDGLRLAPAGGKEKGWYALTEGAASPDAVLLDKWEDVCAASKMRCALRVHGNELVAFFNGQFYTGEFPLEEPVSEGMFRKHSFAAIVPLMELIESLNGEGTLLS